MQQPPARRSKKLIVPIVVILVGLAVVCGAIYMAAKSSNSSTVGGPTINAVALSSDLTAGTQLTSSMLQVIQVPSGSVPVGYFSKTDGLVGQFVAVALPKGTVLQPSLLAVAPVSAAPVTPPVTVPEGDVALSVSVDELHAAGGYIRQDDHVDILVDVTGNGDLKYAFQDVHVLRVGSASQGTTATPTLLLLDLPRAQAEELAFIINGKNTGASIVRFVLRPRDQFGKGFIASGSLSPTSTPVNDPIVNPQTWGQYFTH